MTGLSQDYQELLYSGYRGAHDWSKVYPTLFKPKNRTAQIYGIEPINYPPIKSKNTQKPTNESMGFWQDPGQFGGAMENWTKLDISILIFIILWGIIVGVLTYYFFRFDEQNLISVILNNIWLIIGVHIVGFIAVILLLWKWLRCIDK